MNESNTTLFESTYFADVILPVPLAKLFTYRLPNEMIGYVTVGSRIIVPFGKKKVLTGIVGSIHETPPEAYESKYIYDLLDDKPLITEHQLALFNWISEYYLCHIGEVLKASLPAGLKLSSESIVQLNPDLDLDIDELNPKEKLIIDALIHKDYLSFSEIEKILKQKNIHRLINKLTKNGYVFVIDEIKQKYKPKKIKKIRLINDFLEASHLEELIKSLEKRKKQQEVIVSYLEQTQTTENPSANEKGIEKSLFLKTGISTSSLKTLINNDVFEEFEIIVSRFKEIPDHLEPAKDLNPIQQIAYDQLWSNFEETNIQLLHGVTGSGKTELYIHLIQAIIENGQQVLYLLPEIALTTQIVSRLRKVFGDKMAVYHSKFSDNERVETFREVGSGKFQLIVGVRSSVFLPFQDLGLIIVDEEHDSSYKQYEPAPRYNARDTAIMLGVIHHAKVVLGTATPSVESYYNAKHGQWGYVPLLERFGNSQFPEIVPINTKQLVKDAQSSFSTVLFDEIKLVTDKEKQVLIFQNRRGYAPFLKCKQCETIPSCKNCNVSLTYHMYTNELRCHYCGYVSGIPSNCESCGSQQIETIGAGTEKIEEDIQLLFPALKVGRMDADTTRNKNALQTLIDNFQSHKLDVLVGTQMISKGLDFDDVELVGIFDADKMLYYPDFRASERTFQLILQVSGRAGRRETPGKVIVQVSNPYHPTIQQAITNDFEGFYFHELAERQRFHYPPFTRLIKLVIRDESRQTSEQIAREVYTLLCTRLSKKMVLGPQEPMVNRIRNKFIYEIFIKMDRGKGVAETKKFLQLVIERIYSKPNNRTAYITIDVDPA
jgi:primosomal protein N' (replication factor Y)